MKKYTAIITTALVLAMLVSCAGNTAAPAETTGGASPSPTETIETAVETEQTETAADSTDVEELDFSEFDINSEECLMYRLLDMTVGEIESEFGEMELYGIIGGGTPCYKIPGIGVLCYFNKYSDDFDEPLPKDIYPRSVETDGYSGEIHPGIYLGMDSINLIDMLGINGINYSMSDFLPGFSSSYIIEEYHVSVLWSIPDELSLKTEESIIWGENGEGETAKAELIEVMSSDNSNITVGRIKISK